MPVFSSLNRRAFLKSLAATGALGSMSPSQLLADTSKAATWQNWSGNQQAKPSQLLFPRNQDELRDAVTSGTGTLRAFGGSDSFSAVAPSNDTMISLEAMGGLRHQNEDLFTWGGGTRLAIASAQAHSLGYSFSNEPDINLQSLAGAIATSTHGTGTGLTSISGQVDAIRLMLPSGELLELNADGGDHFLAACCNVGALGIVSDITLRHQPAYRLKERTWTLPLREAMDYVQKEKDNYRHIEIFPFPLGKQAIVKTLEITDDPKNGPPRQNENDILEMACKLAMHAGWLTPTLQTLATKFVEEATFTGPSHKVFANHRTVRFNEMEYSVPAEDGMACLEEVCDAIRQHDINVFFPIEFRYVAADNNLLSMFYQQPSASLSIHQYYEQDYQPLFGVVEPILRRYAGRPHWGKIHSLEREELTELYPAFERFQAVRRELDPQGRMLNDHLKTLFT